VDLAQGVALKNAEYYSMTSENGDVLDDPSEDALFIGVARLKAPSNSFLTIEPANSNFEWHVVIALQEGGGFEVEYRDPARSEHSICSEVDRSKLCRDVTIWLRETASAARGAGGLSAL
jgi:hypothetical protein